MSYKKNAFDQKRIDEKRQVLEWQSRGVWQDVKEHADLDWLRSKRTAETVWPTAMESLEWPPTLLSRVGNLKKEFTKSFAKDQKVAMMLDTSKKKMASAKSEPLPMELFSNRKPEVQPRKKTRR